MPGELGNEEESNCGYYEHRYTQDGEWMLADPNKERSPDEKKPSSSLVMRVLKLHQKEKEPT